jgi:polar amino acid transport system permease protein
MNAVLSYLTSPFLLQGAVLAVEISLVSMVLGLLLGLGLALLRLAPVGIARSAAWCYIWFVRGTPLLLQLVFIYDVLPAVGIKLDTFTTAVIGFSLNEAAFAAEIIRGGILSVNRSQALAASALGMPPLLTLRRIVLPQAMRAILPAMANQTISMIKGTSIASVIFVNELTFRAEQIVGQNFQFFQVFTAAALIYLAMTSVVALLQLAAERHFDFMRERDVAAQASPLLQTLRRLLPIRTAAVADSAGPPPVVRPRAAVPRQRLALLVRDICRDIGGANGGADDAPMLVCRKVHKSYGSKPILAGVDLAVRRGEVVVIMGPSGSGKSTLLRMINHLEPLDSGEILVDGEHVGYECMVDGTLRPGRRLAEARAAARIGMVFQHFNLFDHLTALQNIVEAPVRVYRTPPEQAEAVALRLLASVGLADHVGHLPHRLSGGQQQRVAIARALAVSPRIMLFDEPTSALDPELVGEVLAVIRALADAGMTMIIVTHEVRFARDVADRVVFMDAGTVIEQGPPAQVLGNPEQERTRRFLRMVEQVEEVDVVAGE